MTADEVLLKKKTPKPEQPIAPLEKPKSPLTQIWNWWKNSKIVPYATVRDLNEDRSGDYGRIDEASPRPAAEIGIKISF